MNGEDAAHIDFTISEEGLAVLQQAVKHYAYLRNEGFDATLATIRSLRELREGLTSMPGAPGAVPESFEDTRALMFLWLFVLEQLVRREELS